MALFTPEKFCMLEPRDLTPDWRRRLAMTVRASDLTNRFLVFAPSFGVKEGEEERKLLFYSPPVDGLAKKLNRMGFAEAFLRFGRTFSSDKEPWAESGTDREISLSVEVETGYLVSISFDRAESEKRHYPIRGSAVSIILIDFYNLFCFFHGRFDDHVIRRPDRPYPDAGRLKQRLAHFCPRYLELLRFHFWPLMDVLKGVNYLNIGKVDFLKGQKIFGRINERFPNVKNVMLLVNDRLLYQNMNDIKDTMMLIYKFVVDTLLPSLFRRELQPENRRQSMQTDLAREAKTTPSPSPSRSSSPSPPPPPPLQEQSVNVGRFLIGDAYIFPFSDGSDADMSVHGTPRIFVYNGNGEKASEYFFVVYRVFTATLIALVPCDDQSFLDNEFKTTLDAIVGPSMCDLAYSIGENLTKFRNDPPSYPYIYYNPANSQIFCTLTPTFVSTNRPSHSAKIYGILYDLRKELSKSTCTTS
uniref:Uncharacterized protein n=1 Tax=Romanomermis culicivorax TaxID=13658 RepID=A0A915J5P5_ROMCU